MQTLLVITGMHRSGTSALAGMVRSCGWQFPGELLEAASENQSGYFEAREVVNLNNKILNRIGRGWDDERSISPLMMEECRQAFAEEISLLLNVLKKSTDGTQFAIKDPRISILFPLWQEAAQALNLDFKTIIITRNPADVSRSMFRRIQQNYSRPAAIINPTKANLLWSRYVLSAEHHSRNSRRAMILQSDLLKYGNRVVEHALKLLSTAHETLPGHPNQQVDRQYHSDPAESAATSGPAIESFKNASRVYTDICCLVTQPNDEKLQDKLDNALETLSNITDASSLDTDAVLPKLPFIDGPYYANLEMRCADRANSEGDKSAQPICVSFVSGAPNSKGHIYRIENRLEALLCSRYSTILSIDETDEPAAIAKASDIIVVFRKGWNDWMEQLYHHARLNNVTVVFDIDDLVFDPNFMSPEYFRYLCDLSDKQASEWLALSKAYMTSLTNADAVWVSTKSLGEHALGFNSTVHVMPNGLSRDRLRNCDINLPSQSAFPKSDEMIAIGYASGNPVHHYDFKVALPSLIWALKTYPNVKLIVLGKLDLAGFDSLSEFRSRIETRPLVPFEDLPGELEAFDINIAPLEHTNPLCYVKSELKYFEAALVGVPTVASATAPYLDAIDESVTGFCASNENEWCAAFSQLIEQPRLRHQIGADARQDVLKNWGPEAHSKLLHGLLQKINIGLR